MVDVAQGLERARRIMHMSRMITESLADVIKETKVDTSTVAMALMVTGYNLVKFTSKPEDAERRYWEAARLAKELVEKAQ